LRDIVDSCGAAANFRVRQFHKIEIGDGVQKSARSFADFLTVEKMAGILVRNADGKRLHFCGKTESSKKFRDVASFSCESAGLRVLGLVRGKKMIVFLERGAAASRVGDDGVKILAKKRGEILSREIAGGITNARVGSKRAAAKLFLGNHNFAAVGGEDADGGFVELRESDVGDTACEEGHARAARTSGGKGRTEAAKEKIVVDAREEAFALGETKKFQNANAARNGLQAGTLVETYDVGEVDEPVRLGEQVAEHKIARDGGEPGAGIIALDAGAGMLNELSIFDAGRAGRFARPAVQAFVDVIDEGIGDGLLVQFDLDHLMDAAARRIGLEVPQAVGGAGVETEAAVNATGIVFVNESLAGDSRAGHG